MRGPSVDPSPASGAIAAGAAEKIPAGTGRATSRSPPRARAGPIGPPRGPVGPPAAAKGGCARDAEVGAGKCEGAAGPRPEAAGAAGSGGGDGGAKEGAGGSVLIAGQEGESKGVAAAAVGDAEAAANGCASEGASSAGVDAAASIGPVIGPPSKPSTTVDSSHELENGRGEERGNKRSGEIDESDANGRSGEVVGVGSKRARDGTTTTAGTQNDNQKARVTVAAVDGEDTLR